MGKKGGTSWLAIVKRAFRSPSKDNENKSSRRREDEFELEEEEKKREKRRWRFRKIKNNSDVPCCEAKIAAKVTSSKPVNPILLAEQRHAYAVAAATAEAAVATAQAAVEIVRLTRPASSYVREHYASIIIQTAFRGYLARRALRALRGLVKLQALVRGQNVRNQTKLTVKCIQALVRAQERARLSHERTRRSMFAETNNLWDSTKLHDIKNRKSISNNNASDTMDDWDDHPFTRQGIKEAAMKREKTLAYALSSQIWRYRRNPSAGDEKELEEGTNWLDRWMATKQLENSLSRASTDKRDHIKTLEIDVPRPKHPNQKQPKQVSIASPLHRAQQNFPFHQYWPAVTPSPCKTKPIQVRSASPRCLKEERSYLAAQTPTLYGAAATSTMPNYMAATESAKAKARSQSVPRQMPSTPQREQSGSAKKRLSYPAPEPRCCQNSRSSSFKSIPGGYYSGTEQLSNYSSCYTESFGGEISPCPSGSRFSLNLWE